MVGSGCLLEGLIAVVRSLGVRADGLVNSRLQLH